MPIQQQTILISHKSMIDSENVRKKQILLDNTTDEFLRIALESIAKGRSERLKLILNFF